MSAPGVHGALPGPMSGALPRAALAAMLLPIPAAAQAGQETCLPLGAQLAFCPGDSAWSDARALPHPAARRITHLERDDFFIDASAGDIRPDGVAGLSDLLDLLEAGLAEEAREHGEPAPRRGLRKTQETPHATVMVDFYAVPVEGTEYPAAMMALADGDGWLTLILAGREDVSEDAFALEARRVADLLRPRNGE